MAENPYAAPEADVTPSAIAEAPPLWNPHAAGNWSLLFTPIFGSYLIWKNWQAIGEETRGRGWFITSVLMLLPIMVAPGLGLLYLIFWYFSSVKRQAGYVREQWGENYPRRPWGKALLIGIGCWIGFVFVLGLLFAIVIPGALE